MPGEEMPVSAARRRQTRTCTPAKAVDSHAEVWT